MKSFDITFYCTQGEWKLKECKNLPSKQEIEETIKDLEILGAGEIEKITIDNIKKWQKITIK